MAIATEAGVAPADDAGLGSTGAPTDQQVAGEYNLNIKYGETSIVVETSTDADDNETFVEAMDFGDGRTMHTRTMDADDDGNVVVEVAIVSTDIEAPEATAFNTVHMLNVTTDTTNDSPAVTNEALSVVDANRMQIMASGFTSNGSGTLNYAFDDASTMDMDEAFKTTGTYNGAPGTYRCNGNANTCSVGYDAMGMITSVSGDWIFTPDAGATVDVPDEDYLHYGFWLQRTTDKDGAVTYNEVQTFAGSSIPRSEDNPVRGKATFSGGATGVYVHSISNPDGTEASATSGHFTADAELTAYFEQTVDDSTTTNINEAGQIAPALVDTLSGTINNFMLSGHDQGPGWSVTLERTAIDLGANPHVNGNATGTGGNYQANFHGPTADNAQPHTVVGEFNAIFSNGSVAGGFGARKNDQ